MAISVTDPISHAWQKMMKVCFRPFNLGKWFCLGFCAWLAMLGQNGMNFNANFHGGGGGGGGGPATGPDEVWQWIVAHEVLLITLAILAVFLFAAISAVFVWLRSRGRFMFLDGIVHNRDLVVQPWKEFKTLANSLAIFRYILALTGFLAFAVSVGIGLLIAWPDIARRNAGVMTVLAVIVGFLSLLVTGLILGFIGACTNAFAVPIMYLRRVRILEASREVRARILPGHLGVILLFLIMYILLSLGATIAFGIAGCATLCIGCCLMALPYIGAVVMLPMTVFLWSYALYFFQQFGPEYFLMPIEYPPTRQGFPVEPAPPQNDAPPPPPPPPPA